MPICHTGRCLTLWVSFNNGAADPGVQLGLFAIYDGLHDTGAFGEEDGIDHKGFGAGLIQELGIRTQG